MTEDSTPEVDISTYKLRKSVCYNCPFGNYKTAINLRPEALSHYYENLINLGHHMCHNASSETVVCRGGRNWQLQIFFQMGMINAPTHKAYVEYLRENGCNEIPNHILDNQ